MSAYYKLYAILQGGAEKYEFYNLGGIFIFVRSHGYDCMHPFLIVLAIHHYGLVLSVLFYNF